ncbi:MAG: T9SS type A sorting domain-containing protein [Bacteroidales bacterium]|nr:T9SS type A sorting domain-containing protein [Bacteroidales bacterium]
MKNLHLILGLLFFSVITNAQTVKFNEDFESLPISFNTVGTANWDRSSTLQVSGIYSDSARIVSPGDTASLTSTVFGTTGNSFVYLEFDQICKLAWTNDGIVQVSADSGQTWISLTVVEYRGFGLFGNIGNRFTAASYVDWLPASNSAIPQNSWWKHEMFEISSLVGNSANVMVRFLLKDASNTGGFGNYGWLIDNVKVTVATDELDPPLVELLPPFIKDTAYFTGPFEILAQMSDISGIDTAYIVYTYLGVMDTIGMGITAYDTSNIQYRKGVIPSLPFDSSFCYQVVVVDSSGSSNITRIPAISCQQVEIIRPFDELNIGLGGSQGYMAPMYNDSTNGTKKYSQHISLIKANELNNREADFLKLAWNKMNSTGYLGANAQLKIYIKHTNLDTVDVSSGSFSSAKSGATLVFDSTGITFPTIDKLIEFSFNTDTFHYDGTQNILLLTEWYRPDTLTSSQLTWQYSTTPGRAVTFAGSTINPTTAYAIGQLPNTIIYSSPKIYKFDIGVSEIIAPQPLVIGNMAQDIKVRVKNYGFDTIQKMNIHYNIDGQSTQTHAWTGNLNRDLVTNDLVIGSEALASGNHQISTWTSMPNDSTDMYTANDTLSKDFYVCTGKLNGSYTVGGTTADFQTFQELEERINHCGISASVIFYINPGTYNENIHLTNVEGASANKTITFVSSTANADDVSFVYDALNSNDDYIFQLERTSWVRIKDISLKSISSVNSTIFILRDSSQNNVISNCKLTAAPVSSGYSYGVKTEGGKNSFNEFISNTIYEIGYGFYLDANADRSEANRIEKNHFKNIKRYALLAQRQDSIYISENIVENDNFSSNIIAIKLIHCGNASKIIGNNIDINESDYAKGIYVSHSTGDINSPILIANNFVNIRGTSTSNGTSCLELIFSDFTNVYHNSFALYTGGASSHTVYFNANTNIKLANNIFSNFNQGFCYEVSSNDISGAIVYSDFNSYYSNGILYGKWGYNNSLFSSGGVASLTALSQMDSNSVFTNPLFYSNSNLHSFSSIIDGAATPNTGITTDIDNEIRSTTAPDIGADEFSLSSLDVGVIGLLNPLPLDTQSRATSPQVLIRNFGSSTISSTQIKYQINGGTIQSYSYSGSLAYAAIDTVTLPSMNVPVLSYNLKAYTQLTGDTIYSNDSLEFQLFGMPLIDVEVVSLISPVDDCDMDTNEVVKIKIKNHGLSIISSGLTVSYQLVGSSTVVTETVSTSLNPGADMIYTFNTKVDLSVSGQDSLFRFKIFASHAADPAATNDTIYGDVLSLGTLAAPTISDTTINYGTSVTLIASSPYNTFWYEDDTSTTSIANGASYTTPQLFDTTTYYVESNTNIPAMTKFLGQDTTTNIAGASSCIYKGAGATHQILILASELQSMGINAGNITSLSFYLKSTSYPTNHSQFTIKMGHTNATALTTNFITSGLTQVYQQSFTEVVGWNTHTFSTSFNWDGTSNIVLDFMLFTSYGNPLIRYTATNFNSVAYNPGMGAPGVSVERPNMRFTTDPILGCAGFRTAVTVNVPLAAIEANMNAILTPNQSCGLDTTFVECQIINMGTDTIPGGYSVSYKIDNGSFITPEIINIAIAPADTLNYMFNSLALLPSGPIGATYSITAAISTPNDYFTSNDTVLLSGIWSEYTPETPFVAATPTVNYGDSATLISTSTDSVYWYYDALVTNPIGNGASIQIGPLFDTTIVYAQAQKTVPLSLFNIGNGTAINTTSTGPSPYGGPSYQAWGVRNQFLVRASEMRAMGMLKGEIESLEFFVNTVSSNSHLGYSIKMGSTNTNELNSFVSGLTTIYSATTFSEVAGWNTYNLVTPFYWDGLSNVVIETCFKNSAWVTTGYAKVPYTTTNYVSSLSSFSGSNFSCSDTIKDQSYYKRPNIRFTAQGYGSCPSGTISHQINIQGIPSIDAGLTVVKSPNGSISSGVAEDIIVVLKNYGIDTLNTVSINWMDRDMLLHTYPWTGQLPTGDTAHVTIANHLFMGGQTRLFSWTSMPNSVLDTIPQNDTAFIDLDICMQGTYTIGAGMNYPTLQEAFDDMVLSTVCGSVVLDIDTGIYYQQYILPTVIGVNENQTITIKSIANDSTAVHLTHAANYVLKLINSPYVTIKHITLNANGTNNSNAIVLSGSSHHINIERCVLNNSSNINSVVQASGIYAHDSQVDFVRIENNLFNNGYQSIYLKGSFSNRQKGMTIINNTMSGYYRAAVFVDYQDSLNIINNEISSGLLGNTVYGLNLRNIQGSYKLRNNKIIVLPIISGYGISISGGNGTASNRAVIANNMLSITKGTGNHYGLKIVSTINTDFTYNSINIKKGTANNVGGLFQSGSGLKILNNVFYTKKGRILEVLTPSSIISCDYNDYFTDTVNNQLFVKWLADVSDLNALKALDPNNNVHSISVDPSYYSDIDLHSYAMQLNAAATPISHTLIDFDGEIRNTTTPDIGADEFTLSPIDLGATHLVHPSSSGCDFNSSDSILVQIRNYGTTTIDFSINPATIVVYSTGVNPDTISYILNSGTIAPGLFMDVKVTNTFNLAMTGLYIFDAYVNIAGDGNAINDDMPTQEFIYYQTISNFPFNEDFESGSSLYLGSSEGSETQMTIMPSAASSGNYGMRFSGGDNSSFIPNTSVDDAYGHTDHVARLYSCQIDATNLSAMNLRFDLKQTYLANSYGSWFRVIVIDQNGMHYAKNVNGDSTFRPISQNTDPFTTHTFVLDAFVGQVISLYMEAAVGSSMLANNHGDNAYLDNISIWSPVNTDIGLRAISSFDVGFMKTGTVHYPKIVVENFGASTITSIPISYSVNGQTPLWDTLSVSLGSSQSDTITMNESITIISGVQELCIIAHLASDAVAINDTVCEFIKGLDSFGLNFTDDFEGADQWFTRGIKSQWELGTPSSTNFTSAHSGVNAFVTNLSGDYQTESVEYLYSPFFQIPVTTDTAVLEFVQKMQVQTQLAYGYVQYSFDGVLWLGLGYIGAAGSSNWYTTIINGRHVWSNQTNNWLTSSIELDPTLFNTGASLQFRFVFQSDAAAQVSDGWMIDDFSIKLPSQLLDVGVKQIVLPNSNSIAGIATTVEVLIHNYGIDTLNQIPLAYKVNLMNEVNETWSGNLLPDSSVIYTFTTQLIGPVAAYNLCAYTKLVGDINTSNDGVCKYLISVAPDWDAAVVDVEEEYLYGGNTIKVTVTNLGLNPISQLPMSFSYGTFQSNVENLASVLNPNDTMVYTFVQLAPSGVIGSTYMCGKTILPNDMIPSNDQFCKATTGVSEMDKSEFVLNQNRPNPFSSTTEISYITPKPGIVYFRVMNVLGEIVLEEKHQNMVNSYSKMYNLSFLSPGIYYYSIQFDEKMIVKKMIIK